MTGISTTKDVRSEIARAGYGVLRASDLQVSQELRQEWLSLSIDYSDLPADAHSKGGARGRFMRSGRFRYSPAARQLTRLPNEVCVQGGDGYSVLGASVGQVAPRGYSSFDNAFLRNLIGFDIDQFPFDDAQLSQEWEVRARLIRLMVGAGEQNLPVLEGSQWPDAAFVSVHLAELVNAEGGEISMYAEDRQLLTRFRLDAVLDSYFFSAAHLRPADHPIRQAAPAHPAIRSVLAIYFRPARSL